MKNKLINTLRRFLPFLGVIVALAIHLLIEDSDEHPEAEEAYYTWILYFFLVTTFILGIVSIFVKKLKKGLEYSGAFWGGVGIVVFPEIRQHSRPVFRRLRNHPQVHLALDKTFSHRIPLRCRIRLYHRRSPWIQQKVQLLDQPLHQADRPNSRNNLDSDFVDNFPDNFWRKRFYHCTFRLVLGCAYDELCNTGCPQSLF